MQLVSIDILGPLPVTEEGNKYVLAAVDHFTRWVEAFPIRNQEATTVARKLVDELFCRFSPLEQLHSDQGQQFEAELIEEICKLLEIRKSCTCMAPYPPQGNGMVKRFNRTLLDMLATTAHNHPSDWDLYIRKFCLVYNSSIHSSTGFSPFFSYVWAGSEIADRGSNPIEQTTLPEYVLKDALGNAYCLVRERCEAEHKRQKSIYDEKVHGKPFNCGDLVWLYSPAVPRGKSRKFHHPWKGPFKVVESVAEYTYKIKCIKGSKTQSVNFDRLKPAVATSNPV